jgi:protein-tyrosine phosphatase
MAPRTGILAAMTSDPASEILLQAAPNFRDFGGHPAAAGRRVRRHRLYRSELLLNLTPQDLARLADLRIGLVCDLRSPSERAHHSNEWPADVPYERLAMDEDETLSAVQPEKWSRRLADPAFDAARAHAALVDNYRRMPESFAGDLRTLFQRLADPACPPLLVHCAAGKDRTGFVCAMLLWALGASRQTVFEDYLATRPRFTYERLMATRLQLLLNTQRIPAHAEAALRVLSSVDAAFLQASFEAIETGYDSVERYLEQACGLDAALRARLQDAQLEA